jgi:C4-dicarboxylate-specific signal transduction histidine kinase
MSPRRLEADETRRFSSALLATDEGQRDAMTHANRVAAIGQLSVSIVHEVSQPISATLYNAQTALEVLSGPSPDIEGVRRAVNRILRDCNRAVNVLSRIRTMVKKTPPRTDDCRLNEAIAEVVELTYGEATDNLVSVTTDLADPLPLVRGDRVQLQQVVLNLVINAIEAMSGAIDGPRNLTIRTMSDATHAVIAVQDSGPGLNPATIDRIFEPYYTTKTNGLGVGLSICRSIIESHRGRLRATQNQDRGATFSISLPLGTRRSCGAERRLGCKITRAGVLGSPLFPV